MRTARRCCGLLIGPLSFFSLETHAAVQDVLPSDFAPSATLITFDETGTTELPSIPGVSFPYDIGVVVPLPQHYVAGAADSAHFQRPYDPQYGIAAYSNLVGSSGYSDLAIDFESPVAAIGGWLAPSTYYDTAHVIDFRVLDAAGNLLGHRVVELSADPILDPFRFVGLGATAGIRRAEWRIVGDVMREGGFSVDNVTFGDLRPVPLPAAGVLFGSAMGGVFAFRRRGRSGLPGDDEGARGEQDRGQGAEPGAHRARWRTNLRIRVESDPIGIDGTDELDQLKSEVSIERLVVTAGMEIRSSWART